MKKVKAKKKAVKKAIKKRVVKKATKGVTITKRMIKTILKKEPLQAGAWVRNDGYGSLEECKVCAVGAIVRSKLITKEKNDDNFSFEDVCWKAIGGYSSDMGGADEDVDLLLSKKKYLAALSNFFEDIVPTDGEPTKEQRGMLIDFVENNFPDSITVSV